MLVWKLDLKRLRVDLHDGALASFQKVKQAFGKLGVAEPQSDPQRPSPVSRWPERASLNVESGKRFVNARLAALRMKRGRTAARALAELLSRRGLERPCEPLVA
jgi:hypothetical protein